MLLSSVKDRRVIFVGGKGGVGKTSISAALAHARMRQGQRVLLVSTDPAHNLGHLWETPVDHVPTPLAEGPDGGALHGLEIDPRTVVERHFDAVLEQMHTLLPERLHRAARKHLDSARHAPGSHESAMLEQIAVTAEIGAEHYDVVIYDTAPTGHTLRLLMLPQQLADWAETLLRNRSRSEDFASAMRGLVPSKQERPDARDAELRRHLIRRRERFARLQEILTTDAGFVMATIAEPMPMAESLELAMHLEDIGVDLAAVVVNRRSPADAGDLLAQRRVLEDEQVARLRDVLPGTPVQELPLLPGHLSGESGVAAISDLLLGEGR